MSATGGADKRKLRAVRIRVLKDFAGGSAVRVAGVLISFICNLWIARTFGAEVYGSYSVFIQWIAIASVLMSWGMPELALRGASKRPMPLLDKMDILLSFRIQSCLVVVCVLALLFSCIFYPEAKYYSLILVCSALMALAALFQAVVRALFGSATALLPLSVVLPAFIYCSVFIGVGATDDGFLEPLMLIYFFGLLFSIFLFCIGISFCRDFREACGVRAAPISLHDLKRLICKGFPFLGLALVAILGARMDMLVVLQFEGAAQAGYYAVAVRISEVFLLPIVILNFSLLPAALRYSLAGRSREGAYLVVKMYRLLALPYLALISIFFFFSRELVTFLYGDEFSAASIVLRILLVAQLANIIWGGSGMLLLALKRELLSFYIGLASTVLAGALLVLLGLTLGLVGLALASSIAFVFWRLALSVAVERSIGFGVSVVSPTNALRESPL